MSKGFASNYRIAAIAAFSFAAFGGLGARLVWLHVIDREALLSVIEKARRETIPEFARRGDILDCNGRLLATSRSLIVLGADPWDLRPSDRAKWPELARLAKVSLPELERLLTTKYRPAAALSVASASRENLVFNLPAPGDDDDVDSTGRRRNHWSRIGDEMTETDYKLVGALDVRGVYGTRVYRRAYPHHELAVHVVGYVNFQQQPVTGMERYLNFYLKGVDGWTESEKDANQHELAQFRTREVQPENGYDVILSIDSTVQQIVEDELAKIADKWHPAKATIIVSDPRTGFIKALANYPSFDPNAYNEIKPGEQNRMFNTAVDAEYEPGSVFKIVAVSAAIEDHRVTPATTFDCSTTKTKAEYAWRPAGSAVTETRELGLPKEDISDYGKFNHPLTVGEIIAHSSNKGTVQMALLLGENRFYDYVKAFGFGRRTGFPVGGEIPGTVPKPHAPGWSVTFTRVPMGQSVDVTPIQMHQAMSIIASGGVLLQPQIIREVRTAAGETIFRYGPAIERRVISADTAHTLARMLWGVVNGDGGGREAAVVGYDVAGKTGTANKARTDGVRGYQDHHHLVSSFVGFLPADNPQLDISVIVDDADWHKAPSGTCYGHIVSAPAFHDIAVKLIPYLDIRPTRPEITPNTLALEGGRR